MPGQGPSKICTVCGARRAVANDTPCPGRVPETFAETSHDYDPLEEIECELERFRGD